MSFMKWLKKIDSAIDAGTDKYNSITNKAEATIVRRLTGKEIMLDDLCDVGAAEVADAAATVIPFVKTTSCTIKDTVIARATLLTDRVTAICKARLGR